MIRASDYANLPLAVAAANAAGDALELTGGVVYSVSAELRLGNGNGQRVIVHGNGAVVRATQAMRSVLAVYSNSCVIRDLFVEAQRVADYGFYTDTSSVSTYDNVDVLQPLADGWHVSHGNDRSRFLGCSARLCGTIWHTSGYAGPSPANIRTLVTGTASVAATGSANGRVVTFTGLSVPLTSMGLRRGDWLSVDPAAPGHDGAMFWAPILQVDSASQLTLDFHPYFPGYTDPLKFSIHRGDGFHFGPGRADNNVHEMASCLAENVACSGFYLGGLYGARCRNLQVNAAGAHPVVIGGGAQDRHVLGTSMHGFYTENGLNGASSHVYCDGAIGLTLDTCNASGVVASSNPSISTGVVTNDQYLTDISRFEVPIGGAKSLVEGSPTAAMATRAATVGTVTIPTGSSSAVVDFDNMTPSGKVWVEADGPLTPKVKPGVNSFTISFENDSVSGRALICTTPVVVRFFVISTS